ncbi:MAG TPA: class I fructose-bisphosphate aldolase [Acidobacteriota bacterium]|nr:class I fructose-bisphosphate aldolase [Acidobacteriota bacterium]
MSLADIAQQIVAPQKGVLAADESAPTIKKRFDSIGVESNEENRRFYRQLLFTADGAIPHIGGVILFDETLRQSRNDGVPFSQVLTDQGIVPGIKVDQGAKDLPGCPGEKVTEGLDGLRERLAEYYDLGARFTKWRAVITIADGIPSRTCIEANAHGLARFAALTQEANMVPIVEPEVLMAGNHTLERCADVTEATLAEVYHQLHVQRVELEGTLLKPNMVVSGDQCPIQADRNEVAEATIRTLRRTVPSAVPGIVFLSGGLSEVDATDFLNAMNRRGPLPWELSFSFGRALQASALAAWGGDVENAEAAQRAFTHRARCNGLARSGDYSAAVEGEEATA